MDAYKLLQEFVQPKDRTSSVNAPEGFKEERAVTKTILFCVITTTLGACASVPQPVKEYATNDLPSRSGKDYKPLIPELRAELVLRDAAAACSVAVASGEDDATAPACKCAHSSQADWESKCDAWFKSAGGT